LPSIYWQPPIENVFERIRRPLRPAEQRLLRAKAAQLARDQLRAKRSVVPLGLGAAAVLWALTMLASDAPWLVITIFWMVMGIALTLWLRRDMSKADLKTAIQALLSALRRNEVEEHRIEATGFAEFEELEDEGACYAFQIDADRVVFICGQEFYPGAKFPSLDFSVVEPLTENGQPVFGWIEKRGSKATPLRTIPAHMKRDLEIPYHLELRNASIATVETDLGGSSPTP
jgi:hypothetical protein